VTPILQPLAVGVTGLIPALGFLAVLHFLDTYRLLPLRRILAAIGVGCVAALVCWPINAGMSWWLGAGASRYAVLGAPVLEEAMKGAYPCFQIRRFRVAFMADSATLGFAVGAGFALVENLYYAYVFAGEPASVWIIRSFGTAIMHSGATALFCVFAVLIRERVGCTGAPAGPWAFIIPVAVHSFYNSHLVSPPVAAACILAGVPALLALAFYSGEKSLRVWVQQRLDRDIDLLTAIREGGLHATPAGQYLASLTSSFPPALVADMVRTLEVRAELSAWAKGDLIRREVGMPAVDPDAETEARFDELRELRRRIGRTGMLALRPLLVDRARDLWEIRGL
jgi:RsiW-degrading membrane proteinase PrsW (M82 family)